MKQKNTRGKRQSIVEIFFTEKKFELIYVLLIIVLFFVLLAISKNNPQVNCRLKQLTSFFNADRIGLLCGMYSTLIGIYLAIITIIATSFLGITESLLKLHKDRSLIYLMVWGILENVFAICMCILVPDTLLLYGYCMTAIFVLILISLLRFVFLLTRIFLANMDSMAHAIDEKNRQESDNKEFQDRIIDFINKNQKPPSP
ncbi:hypothetical protein LJC04_02180 [Ruminococcaceae bacterium OttesenSCG-928-O06]|nr:hypothetical protein [Ruminococcaceae bacterium OttesenSCG-928-O06]